MMFFLKREGWGLLKIPREYECGFHRESVSGWGGFRLGFVYRCPRAGGVGFVPVSVDSVLFDYCEGPGQCRTALSLHLDRSKLEGETEKMGVCTKERKCVSAEVLMATPCKILRMQLKTTQVVQVFNRCNQLLLDVM